jgi:excisionase family DNA binding protein
LYIIITNRTRPLRNGRLAVKIQEPSRLLYRPAEAADAMGVSRAKIYQLISSREIPSVKVGHSIRVPVKALNDWIERRVESATTR